MEISNTPVAYIWLCAGVLLMIAEGAGISGLGLFFAGLGAVSAGIALHLNAIGDHDYLMQFVIFLVATVVWTALLWKPLQKFRLSHKPAGYNNIVGERAYVGSNGLSKRSGGEVTWSGTIMKARLADDVAIDALEAGAEVTIVDVSGVTLLVVPSQLRN